MENLPGDFNWFSYNQLNPDLRDIVDGEPVFYDEEKSKIHYVRHGVFEGRQYKVEVPSDFNWIIYNEFNTDLRDIVDGQSVYYDEEKCKIHYVRHGYFEGRKYKVEVPNDFNWITYNELNVDLRDIVDGQSVYYDEEHSKVHYVRHGYFEGRKYKYIILLISHEKSNTGAPTMLNNLKNIYDNNNINTIMLYLSDINDNKLDIISYINEKTKILNCFPIIICNTLLCYNIIDILKNTNITTYWYIHEWYDLNTYNNFKDIINFINYNNLFDSSIKIVFLGESSVKNFKKYIKNIANNYIILCNKYPEYILKKKLEQQPLINKNNNDFFISIIGTIENRKNQQSFIDNVFYKCKEIYPNIKLLLIGKIFINPIINPIYNESIILLGEVDNAIPYINMSDIIISYSLNEVMPLNIIESFYCSKTVISTNVGCVNEMMTNEFNGYLFEINDHNGFFNTICKLIDNPYIREYIGKNAKQNFYDNFCQDCIKKIPLINNEIIVKPTWFEIAEIEKNLINKNVCFIHFCNISNSDSNYKNILIDQLNYIKSSGLYIKLDYIFITMLGEYTNIYNDPKIKIIYYSPNIYEWEFPNYIKIKHLCDNIPFNIKILEIHTKGALKKPHSYEWRKYLEYFLIENHELCLNSLNNYNCVGVNQYFYFDEINKYRNLFSGNFWWANSMYLKTLPKIIINEDRYSVEHWIIGNLYKNDYRNFISLHQSDNDLYQYSIMPYEYRFDIIKNSIIKKLNYKFEKILPIIGVYFISCIGNYYNVVNEQINILIESGLYNESDQIICFVCCQTEECLNILRQYNKIQIISTNENLYEKFAINNYKKYVNYDKYYLYYIHSKSVTHNEEQFIDWRYLCNYFTIQKWRLSLELLKYYDCVGINLKNFPKRHFSGNFWWSKSEHLNKLKNVNDSYLSPEMYILSYMKTNYISIYQSNNHHGYSKYNKELYININDEELINNMCIIPDYNDGDKLCIKYCGEQDLLNEPPIL